MLILAVVLGSLICISAGLYNGFPLVTSDTGTYLNSAIHLDVPNDRPIVYSLFIWLTGRFFSHWPVIWVQGLLLAGLLLRYVREFAPRLTSIWFHLAVVSIAAWLTGLSWYCSQLMPDIFSAIGLLGLGLLVLGRIRTLIGQIGMLALVLFSSLTHSSNLLTFSLTLLSFGAIAWQQRLFVRGLVRRSHWLLATGTVLAGWVLLPAIHAAFGGGFVVSRAAPVFLLARFVEAGIVDDYLNRNCNTANPPALCAQRDKLPNTAISFLWDGNSPYNQTGGLEANLDGYRAIVRDILTSPHYYPALANMAVQSTLRQLTHVGHGDGLVPFRENTNPYWKVQEFAPVELKAYMSSLQNNNALNFNNINERTYNGHYLALLVALGAMAAHGRRRLASATVADFSAGAPLLLLLAFWGLGLLFNAFTTGALANVLDRLQGRVAWLLPFWALLMLAAQAPAWWQVISGRAQAQK